MIAAILLAATLAENVAAVTNAAAQIDAAIVAKGGTTAGGLTNAPAAIAALPSGGGEPEYPHPWRNDGKTHIWWYFGPNSYPCAYFNAQYISAGHTFTVNWGDGTTETIAASASFTARALSHDYAEGGEYEVVISGYDEVRLYNSGWFGSTMNINSPSMSAVRQIELADYSGTIGGNSPAASNLRAVKLNHTETLTVDGGCFAGCVMFDTENFVSSCVSAGQNAFLGCAFETLDLGNLESTGHYAFEYCRNLRTISDLSSLSTMGNQAFAYCDKLVSVPDMPALTTGANGTGCFSFCPSLVSVGDMPLLTTVFPQMFNGCTSLTSIGDMSSVTSLANSSVFGSCPLASLTFRSKTHTEVEAITGFSYFPNRGTNCVFHCSDGDYYRSGTSLLPMPTED